MSTPYSGFWIPISKVIKNQKIKAENPNIDKNPYENNYDINFFDTKKKISPKVRLAKKEVRTFVPLMI